MRANKRVALVIDGEIVSTAKVLTYSILYKQLKKWHQMYALHRCRKEVFFQTYEEGELPEFKPKKNK